MIQNKCYFCGENKGFKSNNDKSDIWQAECICCGATLAESDIAHMLVKYAGGGERSLLKEALPKLEGKKILNIGFSGILHDALCHFALYFFQSDCTKLSQYEEDYFDFVISQGVLETANDTEQICSQIDKIMAPQGIHLFYAVSGERIPVGEGKKIIWNLHDFDVVAVHKKLSDILEYTGERFVPGIEDKKLAIEHMQRYQSVAPLTKGKKVIDIACGEGYGTAILAEYAAEVTGMDIDSGAVQRASAKYHRENMRYQIGNIAEIPLEDHSIDMIVSFETLEHVSQKLQQKFLEECNRVLTEDGVLIISTPNKAVYSDRYDYFNEYHIHEFYHDEFIQFLHQKFDYIKLYNQSFQVMSVLNDCENAEKRMKYFADDEYADTGKYFIAIASKCALNLPEISSVSAGEEGEYEQLIQRVLRLQTEEEKRNVHIHKLDEEIASNRTRIAELQEAEKKRNEHIAALDSEICNLRNERESLKQQLAAIISERQELMRQIRNKEGHIELLLEVEREFERYKQTRAYRSTMRHRKMIDTILPPGSKRLFILHVGKKMICNPKLMIHVIRPSQIGHYIKYLKSDSVEEITQRYEEIVSVAKGEDAIAPVANAPQEMKKLEDYEILCFPMQEKPLISIVIPAYNQFQYTYDCLKSILVNSGEVSYEILIADDCSTDFTKDITKVVKNIHVIRTKENLRFLRNCNHAAEFAKGEYILFLNNDTQVMENWLLPLLDLMNTRQDAGLVGSKLIYPDGKLQEAGGIVWKDASAWNYGHLKNPDAPEFNYVKEVDYISGAAIMIRTSLWKEIGGFDERFAPAYCEDSDLAFEVRRHGYKVLYQPLSVVVHFEGVSNGTDTNNGQKAYQIVNQQKFAEKWKDVLNKEHFPNAENVFWAKDRTWKKPVLLMVDHYVPQYDKDAGSRTVFQYLQMFVAHGFNVKFIGDNFYRHEPYTTVLQQMGIEVLYGSYYAEHWKDWIRENANYIQYAFLNRPHIAVNYIDYIRKKTNAKIIYYGHDLHFLREMRRYELTNDSKALEASNDWKKKELELMRQADVIYYPSEVEVKEIVKIAPEIRAKAIVAYMFSKIEKFAYQFEHRRDIMFVGGFAHTPNIDAVLWFSREVFPKVLRKYPYMKFYILGSNPTDEVKKLENENIVVKGFVSDEELEHFYQMCRISVVPLRYGAGIKGKVIEAMRYGIPVITTSVGAEGIVGAEEILCIADEAETLAEELCKLYEDRDLLCEMSQKFCQYVQNYYSEQNAWNVIKEDFTEGD